MTPQETKKLREWFDRNRPAMIAHEAGEEVECDIGQEPAMFRAAKSPSWTAITEYRPALSTPSPVYRPYNTEELNELVGTVLVRKKDKLRRVVIDGAIPGNIADTGVTMGGRYCEAAGLLDDYEQLDGSPCGKLETA